MLLWSPGSHLAQAESHFCGGPIWGRGHVALLATIRPAMNPGVLCEEVHLYEVIAGRLEARGQHDVGPRLLTGGVRALSPDGSLAAYDIGALGGQPGVAVVSLDGQFVRCWDLGFQPKSLQWSETSLLASSLTGSQHVLLDFV